MAQCKICLRNIKKDSGELCSRHTKTYIYDVDLNSYRLRRGKGKRRFHSHERELTRMLERRYGKENIVTGLHPIWAPSEKGALLEFDILIKNRKILIEYNGIQHYKYVKMFHKNVDRFKAQEKRDVLKQRLAKEQGYKLVIIKYDEPLIEDYIITKIEKGLPLY